LTDSTVKIALKYKKLLPIGIIHQPIKGIIPTVEKAWRKSTGDIIIKTDADARFPVNWIKNIVSHFYNDPELMACGGGWLSWDGNFVAKSLMRIAFPVGDIFFPILRGFKLLVGPNSSFRRDVLVRINGYVSDGSDLTDDQLVSYKMTKAKLKYKRFNDCVNYHSSRGWNKNLSTFFRYTISAIYPKYYPEKSV